MENIPIIRLGDVAGGALQEIAQEAIADVVANMQDVNTPWKPMRMVTIKLKLTQNEDRDLLLKFAGTVENGTIANYGDDGVSQKATVSKGVASKAQCIVPNPVRLCPFRTFVEVEQPESAFVFRMRDDDRDGVQCAIFEADGGAWKNAAMENIKDYMQRELAVFGDMFTVIS